ncbi:unnamed protein product [Larinioides sclopetarius]|uniref:Uncharacterized protein n=1 Tax=Larinioides sclopetarius TaxID=280406 RepID=A0AAV1YS78_9ARAC
MPKARRYQSGNHSPPAQDHALSTSHKKDWYNCFKDGCTSVDSELRSGRSSTSRNDNVVEQVRTVVLQDRQITVREISKVALIPVNMAPQYTEPFSFRQRALQDLLPSFNGRNSRESLRVFRVAFIKCA